MEILTHSYGSECFKHSYIFQFRKLSNYSQYISGITFLRKGYIFRTRISYIYVSYFGI